MFTAQSKLALSIPGNCEYFHPVGLFTGFILFWFSLPASWFSASFLLNLLSITITLASI